MRRRLEIARGLVHRPQVLFLDEPTIGLDPQSRHVIWELLTGLRQNGQLTIVLTTHYLDEAEALCDRVAIFDHGKIVAEGTPGELKARVPGSDTVELTVSDQLPEAELAQLRALPGARAVEQRGQDVRIRADGGAHLLPRAFEALQRLRHEVSSARVSQISLEDVFILLTGRSLRDEAGHSGPIVPFARRFT
jgi:ABC-2 type transport system ATP-binding protein